MWKLEGHTIVKLHSILKRTTLNENGEDQTLMVKTKFMTSETIGLTVLYLRHVPVNKLVLIA